MISRAEISKVSFCKKKKDEFAFRWAKISKFFGYPVGDNHIRIGNRTRLYAVSVLDCTPFSFVGTTISRSHYFPVLLCF